jgi:hypothetical protein
MPSGSPDLFSDPQPSFVDREAFLFMGADPAWTPAREYGNPRLDPDHRHGEPCILCHGDGAHIHLPDGTTAILEGEIGIGSHRVCARCMRYGLDHRLGLDAKAEAKSDTKDPIESRPGYVSKGNVEVPEKYARQLKG